MYLVKLNVCNGVIFLMEYNMICREKIREIIETRRSSRISRIYDWVMLLAIIFGILPLMFRQHYLLFWCLDIFSCICYVVDYLLRWYTSDMELKRGRITSYLIYPFTPMAIVDLFSILPTLNLVSPIFKLVRVSRLMKIIRIVKIIRYYEPLEIIVAVIRRQGRILCTVFSFGMLYIFLTALIMFNAEKDINPETGRYLFENFFDAFYWAACTLTTVGYGDLYPISEVGRFISIISSILGIAIVALPSGIVTAGYLEEMRKRQEQKKKK